jgi:acyl dehydratase
MIGMTFPARQRRITKEDAWAYAQATNDENSAYTSGALAPPMFAVVLEMPALMAAVKSPEVIGDPTRFLRLLHGEHDMTFFDVLKPGETYTTQTRVSNIADKGSGELIELTMTTELAGKKIVESKAGLFIRAEQATSKSAEKPAADKAPAPTREVILRGEEPVSADQSLRYAAASGDHNPIHTDPAVAKKAGLPGIILHGLCTLAFAQKHLVNGLAGGQPDRLRALRVRFARPVLMEQKLIISAWKDADAYGFDVSAEGNVVAKDGRAEIS